MMLLLRIVASLVVSFIGLAGVTDAKKFVYRHRINHAAATEMIEFGRVLIGAAKQSSWIQEEPAFPDIPEWGRSLNSMSFSMSMSYPIPNSDTPFFESSDLPSSEHPILEGQSHSYGEPDLESETPIDPDSETEPGEADNNQNSAVLTCAGGDAEEMSKLGTSVNTTFAYAVETTTESPFEIIPLLDAVILDKAADLLLDCTNDSSRRYLKTHEGRRSLSVVALDSTPQTKLSSESCEPAQDEENFCSIFESVLTLYVDNESEKDAQKEAYAVVHQVLTEDYLDTSLVSPNLVRVTLIDPEEIVANGENPATVISEGAPASSKSAETNNTISVGAAVGIAIGAAAFFAVAVAFAMTMKNRGSSNEEGNSIPIGAEEGTVA